MAGVYRLFATAAAFLARIGSSGAIFTFFVVIDIAERQELNCQCGQVGRFIGRSRNSSRRGKRKYLYLAVDVQLLDPRPLVYDFHGNKAGIWVGANLLSNNVFRNAYAMIDIS
jgi:hypothetical protein